MRLLGPAPGSIAGPSFLSSEVRRCGVKLGEYEISFEPTGPYVEPGYKGARWIATVRSNRISVSCIFDDNADAPDWFYTPLSNFLLLLARTCPTVIDAVVKFDGCMGDPEGTGSEPGTFRIVNRLHEENREAWTETPPDLDRCRRSGRRAFDRGENTDGCPLHWIQEARKAWFDGWNEAGAEQFASVAAFEQLEADAEDASRSETAGLTFDPDPCRRFGHKQFRCGAGRDAAPEHWSDDCRDAWLSGYDEAAADVAAAE